MTDLGLIEERRVFGGGYVSVDSYSTGRTINHGTTRLIPRRLDLHSDADWAFDISRGCKGEWIYTAIIGHGVSCSVAISSDIPDDVKRGAYKRLNKVPCLMGRTVVHTSCTNASCY